MIHIIDMNGAWLILIEIGTLLQVIAICAYLRETSGHRRPTRPRKEGEEAYEQGLESRISDKAKTAQARSTRDENFDADTRKEIKAGHLTRTSKVKFVQKFNFRRHGT